MAVNYILISMFCMTIILPFVWLVSSSLLSIEELALRGRFILFPQKPTMSAYKQVLSQGSLVFNCYMVTLQRVMVGTSLNVIFTTALAYGLSKKDMFGRNIFITLIFITFFFSGGLIPSYLVVVSLGMKNSLWALIIPGLISAWNMLLVKSFLNSIEPAMEESAFIDGANEITIFYKIIIPVSKPIIATITLYCAVSHWNAWFDALIYINDAKKLPIQNLLRSVIFASQLSMVGGFGGTEVRTVAPPSSAVISSTIVITTVPILCVYPFLQKYFVKGVMIGSLKG